MSYNKKVRGENISADELASHNHIQIFNDGSGKIIVCFLMLLTLGVIVYLWIAVHFLIVFMIIGSAIFACIIGGSVTWRLQRPPHNILYAVGKSNLATPLAILAAIAYTHS